MALIECESRTGITPEQVEGSVLFRDWAERFDPGWRLEKFHVVSGLAVKGIVRMLLAEITMRDPKGVSHPRIAFLRGGTVDILAVATTPDGCEHVVHIEEQRVVMGRTFITNSAGMIDGGIPVLAATREFREEVGDGGGIVWDAPVSMIELLLGANLPMPVSPGGTDETAILYLQRGMATYDQLKALDGSVKGLSAEGERTIVRITPIEGALYALAESGQLDLKAFASLATYQLLRAKGAI